MHCFPQGRMTGRRLFLGMAGAVLVGWITASAWAQSFPHKPIRLILPYTAGSPNDVIARIIGPPLSARLGQPVVIENRPGGGTTIGIKAVLAADPDGHTLLFSNTPTHVIAHVSTGAYDPIKDFTPIAAVASTSLILVVSPTVPANSLPEFIAYARANPGKLNFGFGQGTLPHLVGEAFKRATGIDLVSIPYRGGAQAITDMLGGRIHINFGSGATLLPLIRDGKIKALAVTSQARSTDLPDVPTMAEQGLPDLTTVTYYGFFAPAVTPAGIVEQINAEINEMLKSPEWRAVVARAGFEPVGGSPRMFADLVAQQLKHWAPVLQATGFQMN